MRIIRDSAHRPETLRGCVLALGNFDGVHPGHQAILRETARRARELNHPAAAMTFEPHPRRFFNPSLPPLRLCSFRSKARMIEACGMQALYVLRFNKTLAETTAESFVRDLLADGIGVSHVVTGHDFVFGHQRRGDAEYLLQAGQRYGFGVTRLHAVVDGQGRPYSSTRVREMLAAGDMQGAAALLGRPYAISSHVRRGEARGRTLGFPTANLVIDRLFSPAFGVYAVRARLDTPGHPDASWLPGVANFGTRPTFGEFRPLLEVHLFDFHGELYGMRLEVELVRRLREEKRFPGKEALMAQIAEDSRQARLALAQHAQEARAS